MRLKIVFANITLALNCLLLFLIIFGGNMSVPLWMQVVGRIHPLILHVPIGLMLLYAACQLLAGFKHFHAIVLSLLDDLLLVASFTLAVTALMGFFLSREGGYEDDVIRLHKWSGSVLSFFAFGWYLVRKKVNAVRAFRSVVASAGLLLLIVTGHFGGSITHGDEYIFAPLVPKEKETVVPLEEAVVYTHMVQPILKSKCYSCHNESKAKGGLVMQDTTALVTGGKDGKLWDTTKPDLGLMMQRIRLPEDHKEHMPPEGKPQLNDRDITILNEWIKSGSSFTNTVLSLPATDTLRKIAIAKFSGTQREYTFKAADPAVIQSLNNFYRVVKPVSTGSPALAVYFFGSSQFTPDKIRELAPVHDQVVAMNFSKMPLKDADLQTLSTFTNLEVLNLNFTAVEGTGLAALGKLPFLREISLSGTRVDASVIPALSKFKALRTIYTWQSQLTTADVSKIKNELPGININEGYNNDTAVLRLPPPISNSNNKFVLNAPVRLTLKHNINGAEIHYTTDGSDPDSIHSPVYREPVRIDSDMTITTKVYRKGWLSSEPVTNRYFFSKIKPVTVTLLTQPQPQYRGEMSKTLFDGLLAGNNLINNRWLGYNKPSDFQVLLDFGTAVNASVLTVSAYHIDAWHAMPPKRIEVMCGMSSDKLSVVSVVQTPPIKKDDVNGGIHYDMKLPAKPFRFIKVRAVPAERLPAWLKAGKDKPWFFVDELIIK